MDIRCPNCEQAFSVPDEIAGKQARCGACKTVFVVPKTREPGRPCPNCRTVLAAHAILCSRCGLNLETGRASRGHWPEEKEVVEEKEPASFGMRAVLFLGEWVPGLFRPRVVIFSVLCTAVALALLWLCTFIFMLGAIIGAMPIGGFAIMCYAQAIAMILTGEIALLSDLLSELNGTKWLIFFVVLLSPILSVFQLFRRLLGY